MDLGSNTNAIHTTWLIHIFPEELVMATESAVYRREKSSYRPIEIAMRWCSVMEQEHAILAMEARHTAFLQRDFAQWPCITQKLEVLWEAINNEEIPFASLTSSSGQGQAIDPFALTIRHIDLKYWFIQYHPSEKPDFLFNEAERQAPLGENYDICCELVRVVELSINQLKHEQARVAKLHAEKESLHSEQNELHQVITELRSKIRKMSTPNESSEASYLRLIGELLKLILGKSPSGQPYSTFTSQASIIEKLIAYNPDKHGFTQRTLEERFAAANRSLSEITPRRKPR